MTEYIVTYNKTGEDVSSFTSWESDTDVDLTAASTLVYGHGGITGALIAGDSLEVQGTPSITATIASITATQVLLISISGGSISSSDVLQKVGATSNNITVGDNGDSASAILEVYDDSGDITGEYWQMSGATANATNKRIVRAAAGNFPLLDRGNTSDAFHGISASEHYNQIIGIDVKNWKASSSYSDIGEYGINSGSGNAILIDRCRAWIDTIVGSYNYKGIGGGGSNPSTNYGQFQNCIVFDLKGGNKGIAFNLKEGATGSAIQSQKAFKCTAVNCEVGFEAANRSIAVNCIAVDCTINFSSGLWNTSDSGNNLANGGAMPGSSNVTITKSWKLLFRYPDAKNFHLSPYSEALNVGKDLSAISYGLGFNTDFDGNLIVGTWDAGADQLAEVFEVTIKTSGGDYSSMSAADIALASDLTTTATRVFSISSKAGTMVDGESLTGLTSGATGTLEHYTVGQALISNISATPFQFGETIKKTSDAGITFDIDDGGTDAIVKFTCDAFQDTANVYWQSAWLFQPGNFAWLFVPLANRHKGLAGQGYRLVTTERQSFESWSLVEGVAKKATSATMNGFHFDEPSVSEGITLRDCLAYENTSDGYSFGKTGSDSYPTILFNCLSIANTGDGISFYYGYSPPRVKIYHANSSGNTGAGFNQQGNLSTGFVEIYNSYAGGNTGDDWDDNTYGDMTLTKCYSEDGTLSTTVAAYSASAGAYFVNVTAGNEDIHIKGSSTLISQGNDYNSIWDLDGDGVLRDSTPDIGVFDFVPVARNRAINYPLNNSLNGVLQ